MTPGNGYFAPELIDVVADIFRGVSGVRVDVMPGAEKWGWKVSKGGSAYTFSPLAQMNHHTGPGRHDPLRDYMHHGSSIAPLCNISTSNPYETGGVCIVTVIACGRANHAGLGAGAVPLIPENQGNKFTIGEEHQNDGSSPWHPLHLEVQARLNAGINDAFGWADSTLQDHKTYAPGRKTDRHTIDVAAWRQRVARFAYEEDVMRRDDNAPFNKDVEFLQARLNWWLFGTHPEVAVDGVFGKQTEDAVIAFQKRVGLAPTGVVSLMTAVELTYEGAMTDSGKRLNEHTKTVQHGGSVDLSTYAKKSDVDSAITGHAHGLGGKTGPGART